MPATITVGLCSLERYWRCRCWILLGFLNSFITSSNQNFMYVEDQKRSWHYLLVVASIALPIGLTVFAVNWFIDPLWFSGGNKLFPQNYVWNERQSKVNLYLEDVDAYDCIIFGARA